MKAFEFTIPTRVIFGKDKLEELVDVLKEFGSKGLLVTGRSSMRKTGTLDRVLQYAKQAGVELIINEEVDPNPTADYINRMVGLIKDQSCEFLFGLGGGSSMDAAKAIAFVATNGGVIEDYLPGGYRCSMEDVIDGLDILAVTTTAGTGSEVTKFSVITNTKTKEKPGIGHDSMYPKVSIIDPKLMTTVPSKVTASTGIDVLFHALEAYISTVATPITDMYASEAIRLVVDNLGKALAEPDNIEARTNMAWANTLAGLAIVQASTVGIHGMGHPIGGHTNSPHGLTMASIGKAFLDYTYDADIERYAKLTEMFGYNCSGLTTEERASRSGEALESIMEDFGVNISIGSLGVTDEMIPALARDAFATMGGCMDVSLKELDIDDAIAIYKNSL